MTHSKPQQLQQLWFPLMLTTGPCQQLPPFVLLVLKCSCIVSGVKKKSAGSMHYAAKNTAHIGRPHIVSVKSESEHWKCTRGESLARLQNRNALSHHPLQALSMITTTKKQTTPSKQKKSPKNVRINIHRCWEGHQEANKEIGESLEEQATIKHGDTQNFTAAWTVKADAVGCDGRCIQRGGL